jgi:hypothetical protein
LYKFKSWGIKYRVVVTTKKLKVLSSAKNGTVLTEAVMGTEFYPVNSVDGWYEVALPENKKGWISEKRHYTYTCGQKYIQDKCR